MTNEERDIITQFVARVSGAQAQQPFGGSVPATTQPALPPMDREADAFIAEQFQRYPEARYRITQLAFVQEHALVEAQNRIKRMEWELQQAQQQQAQQPAQGGGFFSGLFGGGRAQSAPPPSGGPSPAWNQGAPQQPNYAQSAPPPPQYPPNYQPGMFQRPGSGFLGSALTTATGVAGGMLAANALMGLFSGHHSYGSDMGGFGGGYPGGAPVGSPWATPATPSQDYVDNGSWDNSGGVAPSNQDFVDNGTWDQPGTSDQSSWSDNSGGSWDSGGDSGGGGGGGSDDSF